MVTIRGLTKEFGYQTLIKNASLQINEGDRLALAGPNGSGKSTLFRMLMGVASPDKGTIMIRRGAAIGYLPQETTEIGEGNALEETLAKAEDLDGRLEAKAKSVLAGLGFTQDGFLKPVRELSGGWAMRVAIARLLLREPDLLLLDEPTNHLDLESLLWFQEYLRHYQGALFIITHDRAFLNALCRTIISVYEHDLKVYRGSYEDFLEAREKEKDSVESAYLRQKKQIADMEDFIARNQARLSTASRAQSMIKRLDKLEKIEPPREIKKVRINFPQPKRAGARVLELKSIHKSYGAVRVYEGLDFFLERGWKMALVGHNGAGKSTLLKILAGVIPVDAGERIIGVNAKTGYYAQHRTDMLRPERTVLSEAADNSQFGQTETFIRTVLGTFLFPGDAVFKKTEVLSGGEKSRLALVKLLLDPPNVLLMDEPTTHLDMPSVDALVSALKEFDGTLVFISHDVYFINQIATHVVHVDEGRVALYPGNYDYFLHRQEQIKTESRGFDSRPGPLPAEASPKRNLKADRRERAQEREKRNRDERAKNELAGIENQIKELARQLENPDIHSDYQKVKAIGDEIRALQEMAEGIKANRAHP